MKKHLLIIVAILFVVPGLAKAQNTDMKKDETAIKQVVKNIFDAWKAGDGEKYAEYFTDDIDFTVWNGMQFKGREENIKNHKMILETFYKGTEVKYEIIKMRFLSDEIAAVHLKARLYKDGKLFENTPPVVPVMILKKENNVWRIAVFQNTPVIKRGELTVRNQEN